MKIGRRSLVAASVGCVMMLAARSDCHAQAETDSARSARHTKTEASLAKAAQNPVANMVSLPFQYNFSTGGGLGQNSALVLNVQPVLPLPVGEKWLLVSRTVVPFTNLPITDSTRRSGIGDIEEQAFITPSKPGKFTWGVGPILSVPTATNDVVRTGQWGLGPTAVGLVMPGSWVIGALANNIWRVGGAAHGHVLNTFTLQPFINFNMPHAWAISTAPLITSNWSAEHSQRWTVPLGMGFSKITHVADQPMNLLIQYYHNLNHPRFAGSDEMRLEFSALWPTAAAMAAREKEAKEKEAQEKAAKVKASPNNRQ